MKKQILPFLLVTGLAGCSTMPFELVDTGSYQPAPSTSLGNSIPPSQSMAALPLAAGPVISVIERQRGNALQHEVTLQGAPPNYGENMISVTAFRNVQSIPEKPLDDALPVRRPTEQDINMEMAEKFPNGPLPITSNAPQNGAGTFAYAFGRKAGVSCIYAWQWIESGSRLTNPPVSVRVRLCRPGATEEVLVDYVRQLYLMPRNQPGMSGQVMARGPAVRPYGDALSASRTPAGGAYAAYQPHPYGMAYAMPAPAAEPVQKVVIKKVIVRRVVQRQVAAPQIYSYAPPAPAAAQQQYVTPQAYAPSAASAPVPSSAPAATPRASGGYSAVPMPQ